MTKKWTKYQTEIITLYITEGKTLNEVRRILKGRHGFDASVRGYRLKLEEWGIKKISPAKRHGNPVPSRTPKKTSLRRRPATVVGSSDRNLARPASANLPRSSGATALLQTYMNSSWTEGVDNARNQDPSQNYYALPPLNDFSEPLTNTYLTVDSAINYVNDQVSHLDEAILHGTEEEVRNLLSSGVSISNRDRTNNPPLHSAILKRDIGTIKALLDYGADVDAAGFGGKTALHLAVGSKPLMDLLLRHQPKFSCQDDDGNTALHLLLRLQDWWKKGDTKEIIELLLSFGADINIINGAGDSPLHRVVAHLQPDSEEYINMLITFLNYKPDITLRMRNGSLLFTYLLERVILETDAHNWYGNRNTLAMYQCLKRFLVLGADPNTFVRERPLLNYCLEKGTIREYDASGDFLTCLIQKADVEMSGSNGNCPLHCALAKDTSRWRGDPKFPTPEIITKLIKREADVNRPNAAGASPLELWMSIGWRRNYAKCATILVQAGAVTTQFTSDGKTLFDQMKSLGNDDRLDLTMMFLEADMTHLDSVNITTSPAWLGKWRLTYQEQQWHCVKDRIAHLEECESRPSTKGFDECVFIVLAEHFLKVHKKKLELWREGKLGDLGALGDRSEYCNILRDCRLRRVVLDPSWYTYLLDIIDLPSRTL